MFFHIKMDNMLKQFIPTKNTNNKFYGGQQSTATAAAAAGEAPCYHTKSIEYRARKFQHQSECERRVERLLAQSEKKRM